MWKSLDLAGHRLDLFEPRASSVFTVIFLHDRDGRSLAADANATAFLEQKRLACVCPHGGLSWWSDRIHQSFDPSISAAYWLSESVVPRVGLESPTHLALLGLGMGGQGALRLGFDHPERFPIVVAADAAIDHYEQYDEFPELAEMYSSREHCRQDSATLHIHPARQPAHIWFSADPASRCFRGNDRLHEKLTALGVVHQFRAAACGLTEALLQCSALQGASSARRTTLTLDDANG